MRILHVCHYYRTENEGGVQNYVAGIAARQRTEGHEVEVVCGAMALVGTPPPEPERIVHDGIPVTCIRRSREEAFSADFGCERIGARIDAVLARFAPDVCHVHHWQALTDDVVRRCRSAGARVVVTLHDLWTTCPRFFRIRPDVESPGECPPDLPLTTCAECLKPDLGTWPLDEIASWLGRRHERVQADLAEADVVTTMSAAMRDTLRAVPFFRRADVRVLPIGVMRNDLAPVQPPPPVPGRLRIANWAGLDPRKGVDLLLLALGGSLHAESFELHLWGSTGDDVYRERLERARGASLKVHWHGKFSDDDALRTIASTVDLAVFPSLSEPYGLAQDEAMLLGMPLVVSDRGAPPERVGSRALIVPPRVAELRAALEGLLADPSRLVDLRNGACRPRRLAEHHPELLDLYRDPQVRP
jgi:glycosyltransferase involved in cell wall biosynthesis